MFLFLLDVCLHTNLPSCPFHIRRCCLGKNRLFGHEDELLCARTKGSVVQSSKRYTNCVGKLNIQTGWGHIILDLKTMASQQWAFLPSLFLLFHFLLSLFFSNSSA
jgi:hypothetical protein